MQHNSAYYDTPQHTSHHIIVIIWHYITWNTLHLLRYIALHYISFQSSTQQHTHKQIPTAHVTHPTTPCGNARCGARHSECQGPARHLQSICRSWNAIKWAEHQKTSSCRLNWPPSSSGISRPQWLRDFWVVVPRANSSKDVSKIMMLPYYHLSMGFIQQTMGIQLESSYPDC